MCISLFLPNDVGIILLGICHLHYVLNDQFGESGELLPCNLSLSWCFSDEVFIPSIKPKEQRMFSFPSTNWRDLKQLFWHPLKNHCCMGHQHWQCCCYCLLWLYQYCWFVMRNRHQRRPVSKTGRICATWLPRGSLAPWHSAFPFSFRHYRLLERSWYHLRIDQGQDQGQLLRLREGHRFFC